MARWWVFTVLSETYSRSPVSRRDNRVASRRRTAISLGVTSHGEEFGGVQGHHDGHEVVRMRQVPGAAGGAADLTFGVCELAAFGRNQRQVAQRVEAGAPIAHLFGQRYGALEGGLRLVG